MQNKVKQLDVPTNQAPVPSGLQTLTMAAQQTPVKPKRQRDFLLIDDDLSEFERARQMSKTWSMGQD